MQEPGRKYSAGSGYRYGFNGKEKDTENSIDDYDFGERIYNSRISRWLSLDPMEIKYPNYSPYSYVVNNPLNYIDPSGETVEPNNVRVIHDRGTNKFKVVADLNIKIQVLNISSTANSDLHLQDYADRVKTRLSGELNKKGILNTSTDIDVVKGADGKNYLGQTGKTVNQIWEYDVNVNITIEIISSKEQIEKGAHLIAVVNSFDARKAEDIAGKPTITPTGVATATTAFVNAEEISKFSGEQTGGHEVLHTLGLPHFWNLTPGDKGNQSNFMDYSPNNGFNLNDEQRGQIFNLQGLGPYQINKYIKPAGQGTSLSKSNNDLNATDTKGKLDENKKTVGAN
jgi:RHS repeat-associated protein